MSEEKRTHERKESRRNKERSHLTHTYTRFANSIFFYKKRQIQKRTRGKTGASLRKENKELIEGKKTCHLVVVLYAYPFTHIITTISQFELSVSQLRNDRHLDIIEIKEREREKRHIDKRTSIHKTRLNH